MKNQTLLSGGRFVLSAFFLVTGVMHFVNPTPFVQIVPSYLPAPLLLVYLSGFFEVAGAIGLLLPRWRSLAGWGLIALLLAVLPANIFMLTDHPYLMGRPVPAWILWLRLPLQFVLMYLIWLCSRPSRAR